MRIVLGYVRPYRWRVAAACVAILFTSSAVLGMGAALRYLVDEGLSKGDLELLNRAYALLLAVTVVLALATYARYFLVTWLGERVVADIRRDLFRILLAQPIAYFESAQVGTLLSRMTTDTTLLQSVIGSSFSIVARNTVMLIGGMVMLFVTSPMLTAYVLAIVPLVVIPIIVLGKRVRRMSREAQARLGEMSSEAEESFSGIHTVHAFALEGYKTKQFGRTVDSMLGVAWIRIRTRALLTAIVICLVFGAVMTVLWLGGHHVLSGTMSGGALSAFVFYAVLVAGAVGAISEVISELLRAVGAAEHISEVLKLDAPKTAVSAVPALVAESPLVFDRVSFAYPARPDAAALHDISLTIAPGETVALVGASGAGKSTLFKLLLRFYAPDSGAIRYGNTDISTLPREAWLGMLGVVPQDPMLFSGTVRDNIVIGCPDADGTTVEEAARHAHAWEFIERLPQGLDTFVGEKGVRLSGGQKQRLAIARAILRNPRLLLLDEATSALDAENEHAIQAALARILPGRTTLIIAHRLSTVRKAGRIVVLDHGKIAAIGTHESLLAASPAYARLSQLQLLAA